MRSNRDKILGNPLSGSLWAEESLSITHLITSLGPKMQRVVDRAVLIRLGFQRSLELHVEIKMLQLHGLQHLNNTQKCQT